MTDPSFSIGLFDSGMGGLSILRALRAQMPCEDFVYFADTAHNPYGGKSEDFVIERSLAIADVLVREQGIKALVVACNTATAAAIHVLRAEFPDLPIVGVEPALKPAAALTRTGRVLVLATRGTLHSAKFAALKKAYGAQVAFECIACEGLAERIERAGEQQSTTDLIALCATFIPAICQFGLKNGDIDTLVLGCTHYPLIAPIWRSLVGSEVHIVDNAQAVALRTQELLVGRLKTSGMGQMSWRSSGDVQQLQRAADYWLTASGM
jgi:glutamate racemase